MDPKTAFWQLVLSAELPLQKARFLAKQVSGAVLENPATWLLAQTGLTPTERSKIEKADLPRAEKVLAQGAKLLLQGAFPSRLAESQGAPDALFVWGDPAILDGPVIGIVGTRAATVYGKAAARKFAEALADSGVTVASGGALGIDASAHEATLACGGNTAAVLPGGIDQAYPAVHRTLFKRIRENGGLLVSQFAIGALPRKQSFLMRNGLLAALCQAVLVVEAPEGSGSITAANAAADCGRQVFVVPANISATNFRGSHELIRQGATLVDHPDQILDELGIARSKRHVKGAQGGSEKQKRILAALSVDPLPTERIAASTGLETSEVLAELTMLELDGMVIRASAGYALRP